MANYEYDADIEMFRRTDNRGNHLAVNIYEAQRIVSLLNLGYSLSKIQNKVKLTNPKAGMSTLRSFIRNYEEGNIKIPEDAPAPSRVFDTISDSDRISKLEERVTLIEEKMNEKKSFRERLGL